MTLGNYARPLFLIFALSVPGSVFASALSKPVIVGPKAIGMGGAFVAIADDPSSIFHNPAGMTQLSGHQFQAGIDGIITDLDHTPTGAPAKESAKTEYLPVPQFGYVTDQFEPVVLGLGVFFPHGNGGKYATASANPFNPNEGRIFSLEIAPAIAWQIIPQLSLGATLRIVRVSSSLKGQLLALDPTTTDVLQDGDFNGWGVGGSFGILYRPIDILAIGVNYRSIVQVDVSGNAQFATLGTLGASFEQTLPTLLTMGVAVTPLTDLTLGLMYGFERNTEINQANITFSNGATLTIPQGFTNSHTIHLGADYKLFPQLSLRTGYAKDLVTSIPDTVLDRVVGDIAAHELSFGAAYEWGRYTFAFTWNGRFGSRTVPVTATNKAPGTYDVFVNSLSMGVSVGFDKPTT